MNEKGKKFREDYAVLQNDFNPNIEAQGISTLQLQKFAALVADTPNEDFIALKDSKVQELIQYIMAAIILENERINAPDAFPIQIYSRYKSDQSLADKMKEWSTREEKQGAQITDYIGFKIVPEAQHTVFYSNGDEKLQKLIQQRERVRRFLTDTYQFLSDNPTMTFQDYSSKCIEVLRQLFKSFPKEASARKKYYKDKINTLNSDLSNYRQMFEDSNKKMELEAILRLTDIDIKKLLTELRNVYANEATLYKLRSDLMRTFNESELLSTLGVTVSDDEKRTKSKKTSNGYRSEFIGLNISIPMHFPTNFSSYECIEFPVECQIQTMEQYKDGNTGFSAHTKLPDKSFKLKTIPAIGDGTRYTDPTASVQYKIEFLSHIMNISPQCAIAKMTGNDFETKRIMITPFDLYEAYRLITKIDTESTLFRAYNEHLSELYQKREKLLPTGEGLLPEYIRYEDIPNPLNDLNRYVTFFNQLQSSIFQTMALAFIDREDKRTTRSSSKLNPYRPLNLTSKDGSADKDSPSEEGPEL